MKKAYKVRIYPTAKQKEYMVKNMGCVRWAYNEALQYCISHYEENKNLPEEKRQKRPTAYDLCGRLKYLKINRPWLAEVDSQALKVAMQDLDNAFKHFFRRIKQKEKPGFPRFKSKNRSRQSFTVTGITRVDFGSKKIKIPKIEPIACRGLRVFDGTIKRITISKTPTDKYHASILVDDGKEEPEIKYVDNKNKITAVDLGIGSLVYADFGKYTREIEHIKSLEKNHKNLARQQKKLARCQKGSKNRDKQRKKVARVYEKISYIRENHLHHVSNEIVNNSQSVAVEDIKIKELIKKIEPLVSEDGKYKKNGRARQKYLNRMVIDAAWLKLSQMIRYKSREKGKPVFMIDTTKGPNKICSKCGFYNDKVVFTMKKWCCPSCHEVHDRHNNCASNIREMAFDENKKMVEKLIDSSA